MRFHVPPFSALATILLLGILTTGPICSAQLQVSAVSICAGVSVSNCNVAVVDEFSLNDNPAVLTGTFGSQALGAVANTDGLSISRFGLLRSRDSVSFQVFASPKIVIGTTQALVEDVITVDFAPLRGQHGFLFVRFQFDGAFLSSGSAKAFALLSIIARSPTLQRFPALFSSSGSGIFSTPGIQFTYGQPFTLEYLFNTVAGTATPHSNGIGFDEFQTIGQGNATADFSNTLTLIALDVTDANGNPLPSPPTFTSASGTHYSTDGILTSFADFSAHIERRPNLRAFEVEGFFDLGNGTNGIDPLLEDVTLQVGSFSATVAAGLFKRERKKFEFEGIVNKKPLEIAIRPLPHDRFEFNARGVGEEDLVAGPVIVRLAIGDDGGKTMSTPDE